MSEKKYYFNRMENTVVSTEWLYKHFHDTDLIILDVSQKANAAGITGNVNGIQIKHARPFDLEGDFSDHTQSLPHMLQSEFQFEKACRKLGINKNSKIVVYDDIGIYFGPRVWWMFKTMGHEAIAVLNGGLPEWKTKGFPTENVQEYNSINGTFEAHFKSENVKDHTFITRNLKTQKALLIDARAADRFNGITPEPRSGLRVGHIPGSLNIPFQEVLLNGKYKSKVELAAIFVRAAASTKTLVFTCGSGVTACIVLLASALVIENPKAVYDGSWAEWGSNEQNLIE